MRKVLPFFLVFFMFGCKARNSNKIHKYLSKHNGEVVFSLDCIEFKGLPIVTIEDSGLTFYFLVDTGNTLSFINENGCKKLNIDLEQYNNSEYGTVNLYIEDERYLVDGKKHILQLPIRKNEIFLEEEIDGMIGIDFLSQYDNVIFDYREKKIQFNHLPINNYPIKMYKTPANVFYIYYLLDGVKDFGLIDTGCENFIVRENYAIDYVEIPETEIQKTREQPKIIKEKCNIVNFNKIDIGKTSYKNIEAYFSKDKRIQMDEDARKEHRLRSILGYKFFKDHIIQLDFKNNLFYIE